MAGNPPECKPAPSTLPHPLDRGLQDGAIDDRAHLHDGDGGHARSSAVGKIETMNPFEDLLNGVRSATITDVEVLVRELRVKVGVLSKYVTIRLYRSAQNFTFETSSVMKTALDRDARDRERTADSENEALRLAVRMLTQDYEDAVRQGEMPDDAWLVEASPARPT